MTIPRAPKHFSKRTRALWGELNRQYEFEPDALTTLQVALENLDIADRARVQLETEGLTINGKRNQAADVMKASHALYLRSMRALALDVIQPDHGHIGRPAGVR